MKPLRSTLYCLSASPRGSAPHDKLGIACEAKLSAACCKSEALGARDASVLNLCVWVICNSQSCLCSVQQSEHSPLHCASQPDSMLHDPQGLYGTHHTWA